MKSIKRIFALMLVFGMIASLVACDVESLLADVLEDVDEEDIEDTVENKTSEDDADEDDDDEDDGDSEETTKKKWPWFGNNEETSTTVEITTNKEWNSEIYYPEVEEWPDEPTGDLEYTLEKDEFGEEYYVLSNIGSWRGKFLHVPSEYNGLPVKKIGYCAFMDAQGLEIVEVAEGIEEIDMWAFGYCEKLFEVYLPSTLTYISERVFTYSDNITNLAINSGSDCRYYTVNNGCIIDSESRTLHTLVNNYAWILQEILDCYDIRAIGPDACRGLTNLEYIKIPDNIEYIDAYAFYGCSNLSNLDIGAKLYSIGTSAFSYCPRLKSIYIVGGNLTFYSVGDCLIERNTGRLVLGCAYSNIPDDGSVTLIGGFAFEGNTNLKNIEIPSSVKAIEIAAFEGCTNLRSVKLYEGLEIINQRAFCHDNSLKDITIPSTVTYIGDEAFRGVPAMDENYNFSDNSGTGTSPDDSFGYGDVTITPEGGMGNIGGFSSITVNPDGSYTITYPDGTSITLNPSENGEGSFGGSYGDFNGDFEFSTVVGGNGNITYQPYP